MIVSILLVLTLLFALTYSLVLIHRGNYFGVALAGICFSAIFLVIFPDIATKVANHLGVGRGTDLLLYFCFMGGSIIILLIHLRIRQQNSMITIVVREIAILSANKDCKAVLENNKNK